MGSSTTYSTGVDDYIYSYPYLLGEKLGIEVINAGVGGYDSWETLMNFQFRVLDLDPDMIIIQLGINDAHARMTTNYRSDNSGRRRQWKRIEPWYFKSDLLRFITSRFTGKGRSYSLGAFVESDSLKWLNDATIDLVEKNPPIFFEKNLKSIVAIAKAHDIDVVLLTSPYSPKFGDYISKQPYQLALKENNDVIRMIGEEIYLYDLANIFPTDTEYWADGRHMNKKGIDLKVRLIAEYLNKEIGI